MRNGAVEHDELPRHFFHPGSWYPAQVLFYDQWHGVQSSSGLFVLVHILNTGGIYRRQHNYKMFKELHSFVVYYGKEKSITHRAVPFQIYPSGVQGNNSKHEVAVVEKTSPFGFPEYLYINAGQELTQEEAMFRLGRLRKSRKETLEEFSTDQSGRVAPPKTNDPENLFEYVRRLRKAQGL